MHILVTRCLRLMLLASLLTSQPVRAEWFADVQNKMGTRVEVRLWHKDAAAAERLLDAAMTEFDRIERAMSTYIADSEISRMNAQAADGPIVVSAELFGLIERALQLSELTRGAFDITYDSIGQLYDYRAGVHPETVAIQDRLLTVDYRHVQLNAAKLSIYYTQAGVRINLGGIAKGYAVESVIKLLREAGIHHALASAGGDSRLLGDRRGKPWIVGVRDPDDERGIVTRLALEDEAVSTSGDYERFFIEDDVRYHHIINPGTGRSAGAVRSVTVIGPDATMTDGLSTGVFVLGPTDGMELIESLPGYETVVIDNNHEVRFSTGLDPRGQSPRNSEGPAPAGPVPDSSTRDSPLRGQSATNCQGPVPAGPVPDSSTRDSPLRGQSPTNCQGPAPAGPVPDRQQGTVPAGDSP